MNKREAQEISNSIVDVLQDIRIKRGITQYKLAQGIGMSKSSIFYIENHTQHPSLYTVIMIANYLEVDLGDIIASIKKNRR